MENSKAIEEQMVRDIEEAEAKKGLFGKIINGTKKFYSENKTLVHVGAGTLIGTGIYAWYKSKVESGDNGESIITLTEDLFDADAISETLTDVAETVTETVSDIVE